MEHDRKKQIIGGIVLLIAVALLVVAVKAFSGDNPQTANNSPAGSNSSQNSANSNIQYKDGTYNATGNYVSPGGTQSIKVILDVKNNTIEDATVESLTTNRDSKEFQSKFISGFKPFVVGKDPDEVQISHVSGSSLTSEGFKNALEQIKEQAREDS